LDPRQIARQKAHHPVASAFDLGSWRSGQVVLCTTIANNHPFSVRALAYVIAGHVRHHFQVLDTRYGG